MTNPVRIGRVRLKPGWERPALRMSAMALAMAGPPKAPPMKAFTIPEPPPGVVPKGVRPAMAMDDQFSQAYAWAQGSLYAEGLGWLGYAYLAELAQRPEYRRGAEIVAKEMTRKWIKLKAVGSDPKADKLKALDAAFKRYRVRDAFRRALELDGFFGRSHLWFDFGDRDDPEELKTPLIRKAAKIGRDSLRRIAVVEPMWTYPAAYNSSDPLAPDFYKPRSWYVQGKEVHASRMATIVAREVPDLLKPAYSFGGLSLTQMSKPYVDNWLRTRQSVSDMLHSFSVFVLHTNMGTILQGDLSGVDSLTTRVDFFNRMRDNRGGMLVDKDTEDLSNVSAPLGTLDKLQAQAQEQMASVQGIPLVVLLGITPSGLNTSTDGEIRAFYAWIKAQQEDVVADNLQLVSEVIQLSEFGEVDPDITAEFIPLWETSEAEAATVRKTEADTDIAYIDAGVIDAEDVRARLGASEDGFYSAVDFSGPPPEPPMDPNAMPGGEGGDPFDDDDPGGDLGIDIAMDAAWSEADHPRDADGKFSEVSGTSEGLHEGIAGYVKSQIEAGKEPKSTGLIKHLVMQGGIKHSEIAQAASGLFKNSAHSGHVTLAHKELTAAGKNPPELLGGKGAAKAAAKPPAAPAGGLPEPPAALEGQAEKDAKDMHEFMTDNLNSSASKIAWLKKQKGAEKPEVQAYMDTLIAHFEGKEGAKPPAAKAPDPTPAGVPPVPEHQLEGDDLQYAKEAHALAPSGLYSFAEKMAELQSLKGFASPGPAKKYVSDVMAHVQAVEDKNAGSPAPPPEPAKPAVNPPKTMSASTKSEYETLQGHWSKVLPENKPAIEGKQKELTEALNASTAESQKEALAAIQPIANPSGMGQSSMNDFISKIKGEYGVQPPPPPKTSTLPKGPAPAAQSAIFEAAKVAPHKATIIQSEHEDASGNVVTAKLEARTKNIPGDHYAKVTAAYGNSTDGMTQAVDSAMQDYASATHASHTAAQLAAIKSYRDGGYGEINKALSGIAEASPTAAKHIAQIKGAMKNSFVPADTPVFRGLRGNFQSVTGFADPQEAVGRAFVHKNFASVSRSQGTAQGFGDDTVLKFTIPAGTPGVVMKGQSSNDSLVEREIVMDSNSMFKVEKVEQIATSGGKVRHLVHCTYLGTKT